MRSKRAPLSNNIIDCIRRLHFIKLWRTCATPVHYTFLHLSGLLQAAGLQPCVFVLFGRQFDSPEADNRCVRGELTIATPRQHELGANSVSNECPCQCTSSRSRSGHQGRQKVTRWMACYQYGQVSEALYKLGCFMSLL